jgi:hypothetical protein
LWIIGVYFWVVRVFQSFMIWIIKLTN